MALLPILLYPDARLNQSARAVEVFDARLRQLVSDMRQTMLEAKGIGLAATQVDVHQQIIVIDASEQHNAPLTLINPRLLWASDEQAVSDEGCLSVPGIYDSVQRACAVRVQACDETGALHQIEAQGLLAVCIQHEMDHLHGKVFVEYLSALKRNRIRTKMLKAQRAALRDE